MQLFKSSDEMHACPFFNVMGLQSQTLTPLMSATCESVLKESLVVSLVKMIDPSLALYAGYAYDSLSRRDLIKVRCALSW